MFRLPQSLTPWHGWFDWNQSLQSLVFKIYVGWIAWKIEHFLELVVNTWDIIQERFNI